MDYQTLITDMTKHLHLCTALLSEWLGKRLPDSLGENWWMLGVLAKLSDNQIEIARKNKISQLSELDLSALLRLTDRNWYAIQRRFFLNQSDKAVIQAMFGVRNSWAHAPAAAPENAAILRDLATLERFLSFVDAERRDIWELGRLIAEVKENPVAATHPAPEMQQSYGAVACTQGGAIEVNTLVRRVSGSGETGVVMAVDRVGDMVRYKVFIEGRVREYFEGQVEPAHEKTADLTDISEVQRILTAYQIKKPVSDSLYSLNAARIDFVPYQFRPALKLIKSDTPRLLIADGVGVGKTIEAGLILKEMQARTPLETVIIICPKPLVAEHKWEDEMKRFDESFVAADSAIMRMIIHDTARDGHWPEKFNRLIIPYSLLTDDLLDGISTGRRRTKGLESLDPRPFFDMVIIDEAHNISNSSSQRHRAAKFFCDNANAVVMLTATPVQLGNSDLFTLLHLLRPDVVIDRAAFASMAEPNTYINTAIRYLRASAREDDALDALNKAAQTEWGKSLLAANPVYSRVVKSLSEGELTREQRVKLTTEIESLHSFSGMITRTRRQDIEDFCVRRAYTLNSRFTEHQQALHDELLSFVSTVLFKLHPTIPLKFLMCTLRRQAASCIFGLAPFIRDIVERGMSSLADDYEIQDEIEGLDIDRGEIAHFAARVIELAEELPEEDSKFDGLAALIRDRQGLKNNKMIIFSTFRHTLKYLRRKIADMDGVRVGYVDGSVADEERRSLRERFEKPGGDADAIDILLFTEVGSEGLDYQFCDTLVNYDLPWNPMRVEQRIGRIDRRGQKSDVAHIYNCITSGTIDEEIYERCLTRIGVFERSIGDCATILGDWVSSVRDIILDGSLTADERAIKLEQLADNDVREIQEMERLENDEKHMFGVDISGFTDDIGQADNPWLSAGAIKHLVTGYLDKKLGGKPHLSGGKLRLTLAEKACLRKECEAVGGKPERVWARYLKSNSPVCDVSFNQVDAKGEHTLFLTPLHPLVRAAAAEYASDASITGILQVSRTDIAPGEYPFQLYIWEYTGDAPQTKLVPICLDTQIEPELQSIIQSAAACSAELDALDRQVEALELRHLNTWCAEREKHRSEAAALCEYKLESLTKSVSARIMSAQRQIRETRSESITVMREAEIARLETEFMAKKQTLRQSAKTADIHTTLLFNGVLVVRGG